MLATRFARSSSRGYSEVRFLHSADWQIGMKAAHVGEAAGRVREERLSAAQRLVEAARRHGAEFIALAGDTFEDNGVDRVLVQKVVDILAGFAGPVYLIPGNHDPFVPGSVWEHPAWRSADNVRVLTDEQEVRVAGGALLPCPARARHSGKDPSMWIPKSDEFGVRVGIAHGTVEGVRQDEPDYPIPRDAAQRDGLDYMALGHWHSTTLYASPDGAVRMAYSGTHETTRFGERDSGNALLVDIAEPGASPAVTPLRTGRLLWAVMEEDLREAGELARLVDRVSRLEDPQSTLLDLHLGGILAAQDSDELIRLREIAASRFLYARLEEAGLRPSPEDDSWVADLPVGVLRQAGERLRELADPGHQGERPEGARPEVASRALLELFALLRGARA